MQLEDINVELQQVLITPEQLKRRLPVAEDVREAINSFRHSARQIVNGTDKRLLVVVGPCSIHDPKSAIDYAQRLRQLADSLDDRLFLVMRAYFEKPGTTSGWKGLINDPYLDDSFQVAKGLEIARRLLLDISTLGLPLATEALDPITPQYLQELFSWSAIGARTTESQTHRELASGLSCPVGFKNGTDGSLDVALNALQSAAKPHRFLRVSPNGQVSVIHTRGNDHAHIVLRGGTNGTNYDANSIAECELALQNIGHPPSIMVDCSHANSNKDYRKQHQVLVDVAEQIAAGNESITGIMLESHLYAGSQGIQAPNKMRYGVSVTDACVDWQETESLLHHLHEQMAVRFA